MSTVSISPIALSATSSAITKADERTVRLILLQRESICIQLRSGQDLVRVVSGCAWISHEGKDIVLKSGEKEQLYRGRFDTLITALGKKPLIIELSSAATA